MSTNKHSGKHTPRRGGFGGGPPALGIVEKARDPKAAVKKLLQALKPYWPRLLLALLFTIVGTGLGTLGPRQMGEATTLIFQGVQNFLQGGPGISFSALTEIIVRLVVIYGLNMGLNVIAGFLLTGAATKVAYTFRTRLSQKINALPVDYFNKTSHGDVLSRITNDVDTLGQTLNQGVPQILSSVVTFFGILIMMFATYVPMALVAVLVIPILMSLTGILMKRSQKFFVQQQDYLGSVNGQIEEIYAGHTVVKAFGARRQVEEEFSKENKKLYHAAWRAQFLSSLMHPVTMFLGNLNYVCICIMGAYFVVKGTIPIGSITEFIMYIRQLNQPLMQLAQMLNTVQQTAAAAERVFTFLEEPEESDAPPAQSDVAFEEKGNVKFDHVRFGYAGSEEIVIRDFCADVHAGQKVAIVGPTGAGKTTLVKLLMRFHDLNDGHIYIDDHDIAAYPRGEVRKALGMVLQDTWLQNATIADNIRYGNMTATDDEVKAAAKTAQAHAFIKALPDGYQMIVNEEANNISQGQKQLLTIARAVLADKPILILDEATSSVDTRTEGLIQKAMDNLTKGRTSFIIAHRLSTIRNADLILVLNHGDIVEQGTHEELLAADGFYAKLYNSQFETVA
jgi:ATP-binding cassette subfamily B protein